MLPHWSRHRLAVSMIVIATMLLIAGCEIDTESEQSAGSPSTSTTEESTATPDAAGVDQESTPEPSPSPSAGDGDAGEESFPVTVTRTDEVELVIEERPERIVSLSPGATDTFLEIGAGDQLAAVDMFSDTPPDLDDLPRIDAYQPDPEEIAALDPDLVFVVFDANGLVEVLDGLDIPVLFLDAPTSIQGLLEQVRLVGDATGNGGEAADLADSLDDRIQSVVDRVAEVEDFPRIYHELDNQFFTVGPGSFVGDLYTLLGATNIAADAEGDYPQLSEEAILEANPEVIILPVDGVEGEVTPEDVRQRPGWDVIDAVQNDRIYEIDGDLVSRPGPQVVDGLEQLAGMLYPEESESSDELPISRPALQVATAAG